MYRVSQITRGMETAIQSMVMLDAVCAHVEEAGATLMVWEAAPLVSDCDVEVGKLGAGDKVELRELFRGDALVGEASGSGNSLGWWRVETMAAF